MPQFWCSKNTTYSTPSFPVMFQVIYSLNTKNDDLEFDMETLRNGYEDKLQKVNSQAYHRIFCI